jgi:hypothetical protein
MRVVEAEETDLGCTLVLEWGRRQDFPRARGTRTHPMGKQRAGAPASSVAGERLWPRRASATMGRGSSPQRARGNIALPRDRRQAHDNDGEHSGEATASGVPLPGVPSPLCRCPPPLTTPRRGGVAKEGELGPTCRRARGSASRTPLGQNHGGADVALTVFLEGEIFIPHKKLKSQDEYFRHK